MNKNATEFEWHATESAPQGYPMGIIMGNFLYQDKSGGLYIPTGGILDSGWGQDISRHVTGPRNKPLPDRVDIHFISYAENQFYHGSFALPYDEILALFRAGVQERPDDPIYSGIMVGIAVTSKRPTELKRIFSRQFFKLLRKI